MSRRRLCFEFFLLLLAGSCAFFLDGASAGDLDGAKLQIERNGQVEKYTLVAEPAPPPPPPPPPATQPTTQPTTEPAPPPPPATIKVTGPLTGPAPLAVFVHGVDTPLSRGLPQTALYLWDFGDVGSKYNLLEGFNAAHIYDKPGSYTIALTVIDPAGVIRRASVGVVVGADTRPVVYATSQAEFLSRVNGLADNTVLELRGGQTYNLPLTFTRLSKVGVVIRSRPGTGRAWIAKPGAQYNVIGIDQDKSRSVLIESIGIDGGGRDGIALGGVAVAVRDVELKNTSYALQMEGRTAGALVQDCSSISNQYFAWLRGSDNVILGNRGQSLTQHAVRGAISRANISQNWLKARSCIWGLAGEHLYVHRNTLVDGSAGFNPTWGTAADLPEHRSLYGVWDHNIFEGGKLVLNHGCAHQRVTDNVFRITHEAGVQLVGYSTQAKRGIDDLQIKNNTVVVDTRVTKNADGTTKIENSGAFLWLIGDAKNAIAPEATNVTVENNLLIAPKIDSGMSGGIVTFDQALKSFTRIDGNVWAVNPAWLPRLGYAWPTWYDAKGNYPLDRWNALPMVGDDAIGPAPTTSGAVNIVVNGRVVGARD